MPLAEVQRALAHIYTNEGSRELLHSDAPSFAAAFGLNAADLEQVASMGGVRLRAYTDSLDRKRAKACAHELPLSARALGTRFRAEFLRFARRVPLGDGPYRYRDDAIAFAKYFACEASLRVDAPASTLVAYESDRRLGVRYYRFDVRALVRATRLGEAIEALEPKRTFVVRPWPRREFVLSL